MRRLCGGFARKGKVMPKSLDVLIGLSLVMLVTSMAVTLLTQAITSLLNSDGNRLFDGLRDLLMQIDPDLSHTVAGDAVTAILTHPIVADSAGGWARLSIATNSPSFCLIWRQALAAKS